MMGFRGPHVRVARRLGMPLSPKAARYMERRPYPPGPHGRARHERGDYAIRLLEKQKLRFFYDVSETQLRRAFAVARRRPGNTGEELIAELETRLSSVVYRAGIAPTIHAARQYISHGHICVDGCKVVRPSYRLRPGQVVAVRDKSRALHPFRVSADGAHASGPAPDHLGVELAQLRTTLLRRPSRADARIDVDERLVVEHYTR
jgi:small subunit ribosomal protein S4